MLAFRMCVRASQKLRTLYQIWACLFLTKTQGIDGLRELVIVFTDVPSKTAAVSLPSKIRLKAWSVVMAGLKLIP